MKNWHFYIQSAMLILAVSFAVQIPLDSDAAFGVVCLEFIVGIYQLGLSTLLMFRLSSKTPLLRMHCIGSWTYLLSLTVLASSQPNWMNDELWIFVSCVLPWAIAIFFLVVLDELEAKRGYRV